MPVIVTSSHSWPMVNLLDQVQLGMVCVQVKSFPFWTTSVTTLWSVLALRSPAAVEFKLMTIHMYPFMAYVSIRKSVYQSLPETPHNCLDSPAHISQRKTWWWKRRDEVSKEFIRQKKKKSRSGLRRILSFSSFLNGCPHLPLLFPSPHHVPTPHVCEKCQPLFCQDNLSDCFMLKCCNLAKIPSISQLLTVSASHFASLSV